MDNLKERVLINGNLGCFRGFIPDVKSLNDKKINNPPHVGLALNQELINFMHGHSTYGEFPISFLIYYFNTDYSKTGVCNNKI